MTKGRDGVLLWKADDKHHGKPEAEIWLIGMSRKQGQQPPHLMEDTVVYHLSFQDRETSLSGTGNEIF